MSDIYQTARAYYQLMRFDKPIGWLLLMWPTLSALWLAAPGNSPSLFRISVFALGVIIMRAAGCIINDMADVQFDKAVARTAHRPLAAGRLTCTQAFYALLGLLGIALILLLQLPALCFGWALIGLSLTILYPFTKRFLRAPQLILGIVFNWGIILAVVAEQESVPLWAWLFYFSHLAIVVAYDTIYARMDEPDDRQLPIHSLAMTLGSNLYPVILGCYSFSWLGFILVGLQLQLSWIFYVGVLVHAMILLSQWYRLAICGQTTYYQAFFMHHWAGLILFLSIIAAR